MESQDNKTEQGKSIAESHKNLIGREFRHFKGNHYRLEGFAKDSETLEAMVVYRALYGEGGLWVRPLSMWNEPVERDGKLFPRFTFAGDDQKFEE